MSFRDTFENGNCLTGPGISHACPCESRAPAQISSVERGNKPGGLALKALGVRLRPGLLGKRRDCPTTTMVCFVVASVSRNNVPKHRDRAMTIRMIRTSDQA